MIRLTFLFLIFSCAVTVWAEDCEDSKTSCQYYLCMERKLQCGELSYFKGFAYKYCSKYFSQLEAFSPRGQAFIKGTFHCLIAQQSHGFEGKNCNEMGAVAIRDHAECYYNNGYCDLSVHDKYLVFEVLKSTIINRDVVEAGVRLAQLCLINKP